MDASKLIDQFAEMYPYDKERALNKRAEADRAIQARQAEEQAIAQAQAQAAQAEAVLPPPKELEAPVAEAKVEAPKVEPKAEEPKAEAKEFRPTMMSMLDSDRLKREAVRLQHEQRAFRIRIARGVLLAVAIGSLVIYFLKRK